MRVGYSIGFESLPDSIEEYRDARYGVSLSQEVFPDLEDAKTVLAAEKLRNPTLKFKIFAVYEGDVIGSHLVMQSGRQTILHLREDDLRMAERQAAERGEPVAEYLAAALHAVLEAREQAHERHKNNPD